VPLEAGADHLDNGLLVGELAGLELGVEQLAVRLQLEAASLGRDEGQVVDLLLVRRQQFGRQTDSLGLVVSHRAVAQLQFHGTSPTSSFPSPGAVTTDPSEVTTETLVFTADELRAFARTA
jgi:hypothetical protein